LAQPLFLFFHPPVAHRLVLAGVRLHLATVDRHPPQLHRTQLQRHPQHLPKQPFQRRQMDLAEVRDCAEVRLVARSQDAKRHVLLQPLPQSSRGEHPHAVAVHQNLGHHPRVIGRIAALFLLVIRFDLAQLHLIDQIADEICQVVLREPVAQTRW